MVNPPIQKVIDTAVGEVGYHEGRSGGHWNNQEKYAGQVPGLGWVSEQGQPWCAVFVSWVALKAGVPQLFPRTASCDIAANWFRDKGQFSATPSVGAQVFYGTPADLVHTGVVIAYDATTITTVEGNTNSTGSREGDGVYRKVRQRRDPFVVGYGHPQYPVAPPPPPPPPTPPTVVDVVATANVKDTLSDLLANRAVELVLGGAQRPELIGLQEWSRGAPACIRGTHLKFARSADGGGPIIYDDTRYTLTSSKTQILAPAGFVGHLPGRRSHLDESRATVYRLIDELGGPDTIAIVAHLTAEVQKGKRYRLDLRHRLRVLRHKLEVLHLSNLARWYRLKGLRVYVFVDTNFDGLALPPLVSCWVGHDRAEAQGTLGPRTVDEIYGPEASDSVHRIPTPSDHDAVVATYPRR